MNRLDREIDRLCLDVVLLDGEQDEAPSLADMARRAQSILDARKPKRRQRRRIEVGRMKPSRMDLQQKTFAVCEEVRKRADGKCETCGQPEHELSRLEMHHLTMGTGKRRQEQSVRNCLMVCAMCHMVGHRRILYAGPGLLEWANRYGYTETAAAIQRRIDKALIADPTWPRNEDEIRRLGPARAASGSER